MKRLPVLTLLSAILFGMITTLNAQIVNSVYYPKRVDSSMDMSKVKANINDMLGKKTIIRDKKNNVGGTPQDVVVLDDRIEFKIKDQKVVILFSDIIDNQIVSTETNRIADDGKSYQGPNPFSCQLELNNFVFYFKGITNCDKFANVFFFIQFNLRASRYDTLLTDFKPIAEKYIALSSKPAMSEEQRKFILAMSVVLWNAGLIGSLRRYNEFGVRLALGEGKDHIYKTLIYEGILIGLIGTVIGTAIGLAFSYFLQNIGINIGGMMKNSSLMIPSVVRTLVTPAAFYIGFIPGLLSMMLGTALAGIGIYRRKTAQLFKELEV